MFPLLLAFVFAAADDAPTIWGGVHVVMEVTESGARLEFDCASGTITQPLRPDAEGRFSVRGTFTPGHGGPERIDEPSRTRPATYSGTIDGDAMTLQIDDQELRFHLTRGRPGKLMKCR